MITVCVCIENIFNRRFLDDIDGCIQKLLRITYIPAGVDKHALTGTIDQPDIGFTPGAIGNHPGIGIIQQGYAEILNVTQPDPALLPDQQLRSGLEAYLTYVEQHPHLYRAIFRSAASADRSIQDIVSHNLDLQAQRLLSGLGVDQEASAVMLIAVRSWFAFLIHAVLDWLDQRAVIGRQQLLERCMGALEGAIKVVYQQSVPS